MSDALYWLAYFASGAAALALVRSKGWPLAGAMLAGTAVGIVLSLLVMLAMPREDSSPWFQVELTLNGSLSLIFAGAGAAIGFALRNAGR